MNKPWPRSVGALAGFIFLALFVVVPEARRLGWPQDAFLYFAQMGLVSGTVGAAAGWFLVAVRNRLLIQR